MRGSCCPSAGVHDVGRACAAAVEPQPQTGPVASMAVLASKGDGVASGTCHLVGRIDPCGQRLQYGGMTHPELAAAVGSPAVDVGGGDAVWTWRRRGDPCDVRDDASSDPPSVQFEVDAPAYVAEQGPARSTTELDGSSSCAGYVAGRENHGNDRPCGNLLQRTPPGPAPPVVTGGDRSRPCSRTGRRSESCGPVGSATAAWA